MSSESRDALAAEVGQEVRELQVAVDAFDEAVAARLGVNRTDLRCLDILLQDGPTSPGRLTAGLGLTTGSMTVLLDRLARLGYVTRRPDPADRRKVIVSATPEVDRLAAAIYQPVAEDGARMLGRYSGEQLRLVRDFLRRSREIQQQHLARIRSVG